MTPKIDRKWFKKYNILTLDHCLENISIISVSDLIDNREHYPIFMKDWFCVNTPQGVNSYFATEQEALSYRLHYINRLLNK